ncbi:hypothetical protein [Roseimaritima ulvae]|uniref:Uncharacterized protein n=1 Tax=Roseimaritima ulvae TaxID=980254 RepID=A0A5B9QIN4_9BACT|nr:hypothetical protein [Roseimaritima ulvae]QEG38957.1 hypothetical protein UC8_09170 [Roseimaritima ulvae]
MTRPDASSKREPLAISQTAISDLERVLESIEALEIRMCVLSVQMQYDHSPHASRAALLSREAGEISERLENILTFGV